MGMLRRVWPCAARQVLVQMYVLCGRNTVRRVVLTSSTAAVRFSGASTPPVSPPLFSEQDWNEVRVCME